MSNEDMLCLEFTEGFVTLSKKVLVEKLAPKGVVDIVRIPDMATGESLVGFHYRDRHVKWLAPSEIDEFSVEEFEAKAPDRAMSCVGERVYEIEFERRETRVMRIRADSEQEAIDKWSNPWDSSARSREKYQLDDEFYDIKDVTDEE